MAIETRKRVSLLSSQARIQAPFIKVTIGNYTFGVFSKTESGNRQNDNGFYIAQESHIQYPSYVKSLNIIKINGQVNQYTLTISYPVKQQDDPNFFEKVFSSVSKTRKIIFSYGDSAMPSYIYKDEEAIITKISTNFGFGSSGRISSVLTYTISAISSATLSKTGCFTFMNNAPIKPSDEIKRVFSEKKYGLSAIFTGMSSDNIDTLIDGSDQVVKVESKVNIAPLDYITYLVGCMIPAGATSAALSKDIYILTIHDDTVYDKLYNDTVTLGGPYFKVSKTSYNKEYSDAYEIDIGYNTSTIVTNFAVDNNENYSIYYDYTNELYPEEYTRRLDNNGKWEDVFAPTFTSKNERRTTLPQDSIWYTKLTKYPISASITIQGLLRPATLMTYVRLNVIFPGGNKHISSGLYIVTQQIDQIDESGYRTTLKLTKISGDE